MTVEKSAETMEGRPFLTSSKSEMVHRRKARSMADRHITGGQAFWGPGVVCLPSIQEALSVISSADASDWWGVPVVPAFPLEAKGGGSSLAARGAWKSGGERG